MDTARGPHPQGDGSSPGAGGGSRSLPRDLTGCPKGLLGCNLRSLCSALSSGTSTCGYGSTPVSSCLPGSGMGSRLPNLNWVAGSIGAGGGSSSMSCGQAVLSSGAILGESSTGCFTGILLVVGVGSQRCPNKALVGPVDLIAGPANCPSASAGANLGDPKRSAAVCAIGADRGCGTAPACDSSSPICACKSSTNLRCSSNICRTRWRSCESAGAPGFTFEVSCVLALNLRFSSSNALLLARSCASCSVNLCELLGVGKGSRTLLEPPSWLPDPSKAYKRSNLSCAALGS